MKKGFTLIELMVVIVIIGILAAIAVPKMFGMSAKAKAAEVGPAAGDWAKIQAAYVLEAGDVGSFISIGYLAPGATASTTTSSTTNFTYVDGGTAASVATWQATSLATLNNCDIGGVWKVTYTVTGNIVAPTVTGSGCQALTTSFMTIK